MIKVYKNPKTLLPALADFMVSHMRKVIHKEARFNLVLAGGNSPKELYELLAGPTYRNKIEWSKVYFFFGDERYVPLDHPDSNYRMAFKTLFEPLHIPETNIFPIDTALKPDEAAKAYEKKIREHFKGAPRFDLILLGLGDNSHTASLFPHTTVLHEQKALVKDIYVEEVKMQRITFTASLINQAHTIAFLVYGAGKAEAVHHILNDPRDIEKYPAQLIQPVEGELNWFLDESAARLINALGN